MDNATADLSAFLRKQKARDEALRQSFHLFADAQDALRKSVEVLAAELRELRTLLDI